jgi:hypothetical protein
VAATPRNLRCDIRNATCEDPRCKRGACVIEIEERQETARQAKAEAETFRRQVEEVARDILRMKGVRHPTLRQIKQAAENPKVIAETRRRLAVNLTLPHSN